MSVLSVVCCHILFSATNRSLAPEASYPPWCVVVCDVETLMNEAALDHIKLQRQKKNTYRKIYCFMRVVIIAHVLTNFYIYW